MLLGVTGPRSSPDFATPDRSVRSEPALRPGSVRSFVSRPDLRPPAVAVAGPARPDGVLFLGPGWKDGAQGGPLIVDPSGEPVWFHPLPSSLWGANFGVSDLGGEPVLAWWQGTIEVPLGYGRGEAVVLDGSYREQRRIQAANGRVMDVHELQLTPEGTALFTCHPQAVTRGPVRARRPAVRARIRVGDPGARRSAAAGC